MLNMFRTRRSSVLVWILMALLIVGLAGFGIGTGGGLAARKVAEVGNVDIGAEAYARAVDQEIQRFSEQIGRPMSIDEARRFGIDRLALARLVNEAALDGEAARLGISAGDDAVREQISQIGAFQGSDGFDRDAYTFALQRVGLTASEFEASIRKETSRRIVTASTVSTATLPDTATEAFVAFAGETRSFRWLAIGEEQLDVPIGEPGADELETYYQDNQPRYMKPETRRVSYAIASPARVAETIEVPEAELRAAYDAQPERFETPERRLIDRIGFRTEEDAEAARARIDAGEATFDDIAAERGLSSSDTDQGLVARGSLQPEADAMVFGFTGPGVVGPAPSPLGPSLYRINAIIDAQTTPFEEAREELRRQIATRQAEESLLSDIGYIEDMIAGGATLEELVSDTPLQAGEMEVNALGEDPLSRDPAVIEALGEAREGEETDLVQTEDGSYVVLRLEGTDPEAPIPLEEVRDQVAADWRAKQLSQALAARAEEFRGQLDAGETLEELAETLGTEVSEAGPVTRSDTVEAAPPQLVGDIFAAEPGDVVVVEGPGSAVLARLDDITPYNREDEDLAALRELISTEFSRQAKEDLGEMLVSALRDDAGVRLNQGLIDETLDGLQ